MLERLIAEHEVEGGVGERDVAGMTVAARAELRGPSAVEQRLDARPRAPGQLDDPFTVRTARVAELEHAQAARRAQVRLGRGDDALA